MDVLPPPLDLEELAIKLSAFLRPKVAMDVVDATALTDPHTGLYSTRGLGRRAREIGAQAAREHRPLACMVFGLQPVDVIDSADGAPLVEAVRRLGGKLRTSDALGRLARHEFGLVAPGTDPEGAVTVARRVRRAIETAPSHAAFRLRVGYAAAFDFALASVTAVELLGRASQACRRAEAGADHRWIEGAIESGM